MGYETLRLERDGGLAVLTLARPEVGNAINLAMARELLHALLSLREDPSVRALLLRGEGRMFCAGGDLKEFGGQGEEVSRHLREVTAALHPAVSVLSRMDPPAVAVVQGSAAGAGFSLACACDVVLVGASARFLLAYTQVGLTPDGSATWFLPRLVGLRRALELVLTNRSLTAEEAVAWGLATRVVADEALDEEGLRVARALAGGPTLAFGRAKRLLRTGLDRELEAQMELEAEEVAASARTADGREGIAAFLEKREPRFRGR